jgi:hypothetical protein
MKKSMIFVISSLLFFNCICESDAGALYKEIYYEGGDVILKLEPEKVETKGELIKINITVENIPPKDSLEAWCSSYSINEMGGNSYMLDGGLGGVQIYLNYSTEYLEPIGFNWSDLCKSCKSKEYEFKDGRFSLNIQFDEDIFKDRVVIGTLIFNPKKEGKTYINFLNKYLKGRDVIYKTALSSAEGRWYDGHYENYDKNSKWYRFYYPNTTFKGCEVIIKGIGKENITKNLKEELEIGSGGITKIINKVNIVANQKTPKVIVKEINVSEIEPNISIVLNVEHDGIDFKLLGMLFVVSLIGGAIFGTLGRF